MRYVTYQLFHHTQQPQTQQLLQEIHFQLDEVADQPATFADCDQVQLSPLFDDFRVVLDYCRLFLADSGPLAAHTEEVRVFAILLPTEVIFEEFIEGFVRTHLDEHFHIRSQTRDLYLATATPAGAETKQYFQLRHDLLLKRKPKSKEKPLVIDTKYKTLPVTATGNITPDGVTQADMYQLVSYALRRGTYYTYLFYPDSLRHPASNATASQLKYEIKDQLSGKKSTITVAAHRLPIIIMGAHASLELSATNLNEFLPAQEQQLVKRLKEILSVSG